MRNLILLIIIMILMSGCSTSGHVIKQGTQNLTSENIQKIVKNKTTKSEIEALFGQPQSKINSGLGEMWTYSLAVTRFESQGFFSLQNKHEINSISLVVTFDEKGLVKDLAEANLNPIVPVKAEFY